ncbi:MAG: flavodoxin [Parabacteroides sp.]|nr:flavodoxin [Parabacteroides sp.]
MTKIYQKAGIVAVALLGSALLWVHAETENNREIPVKSAIVENTATVQVGGKVLVTYFTWPEPDGTDANTGASRVISNGKLYGNTEYIAHLIREATGGNLFAIKTERTYPSPHRALIDAAKKEAEAKQHPRLTTHISNLKDYDIIFVGYPNWWYDMPMAIYSFFDEYDFSGKTVIPFVTHGGSRFSQSVETIAEMEQNAKVIKGPSVAARNVPEAKEEVVKWLEEQGLKK